MQTQEQEKRKQERGFHRLPRAYQPRLSTDELVIKAPPVLQPTPKGPAAWFTCLLPFIGGVVVSLGSVFYLIFYHSGPPLILIVIALGIPLVSVTIGLGTNLLQRYTQAQQRKAECALYLEYLKKCSEELQKTAEAQREVNTHLYPDPLVIPTVVREEKRKRLWERRFDDLDFLHIRVGLGRASLCRPVRLDPTDPMVGYDPALVIQAENLVAQYQYLDNEPAVLPLRDYSVVAISGSSPATRSLVRAILCQIAAFHAPNDVRFITFFPPNADQDWNWLKWLPHVWRLRSVKKSEKPDAPEHLCLLADTIDDCRDLIKDQILPELEQRRKLSQDKKEAASQLMHPHLILILDGFAPGNQLAQLPGLDDIFHNAAKLGMTVLCLVQDTNHEPSTIQARIKIAPMEKLTIEETMYGGSRRDHIQPDDAPLHICEQLARSQTRLTLTERGAQQDLSQDVRLLELLDISSADALDVAKTWQPRQKHQVLRIPIGRRGDGEPLLLDVKEAAEEGMGVHGLVVGATGSGKSELLRTIVTSLAITHDPQTLNFVLVDFKGGASFADFKALPHVAGVITNLQSDLTLVNRFYASLFGEQQRRQHLLQEAGNLSKIQEYQVNGRTNPALESMPYLLLIVDEFAELIAAQPDFLDLFTKIGRVGRSLGIYMLLATQRIEEGRIAGLAGHLRYRICLRTFTASESVSMLGTPDAYYLASTPGVGYFKYDTNAPDIFKTALISTPYISQQQQASPIGQIRLFTPAGKLVMFQADTNASASSYRREANSSSTEMNIVIERLAGVQPSEKSTGVHQVWLPPLGKTITLDQILVKCHKSQLDASSWQSEPAFGSLRIPLGLLDNPLEQAQEPFFLDFSGTGGHLVVVGAQQSGKSTLLRTIVTSFMVTHSPRDVQVYGIDLGGGLLGVFEHAPHVGDVFGKGVNEKIPRLIRRVRTIINEREILFRKQGIDSMKTYRRARQAGELADTSFGDVFLIIDNLGQFLNDFNQLEAELTDIVANGLNYGVHVIVATNRWAEVRARLRENIGSRLELRLHDPADSEFGKAVAATLPVGVPGRGLNSDRLQFQTALPIVNGKAIQVQPDPNEQVQEETVRKSLQELVQRARAAWKGKLAPHIPLLPAKVTWEDLWKVSPPTELSQQAGVPLGLEELELKPICVDLMKDGPHFVIYGDTKCGKTTVLRTWIQGLVKRYSPDQAQFAIIDYRGDLSDVEEYKQHLYFGAYASPAVPRVIEQLKSEMEKRLLANSQTSPRERRKAQQWTGPHYFVLVDDYETILTSTGNPLSSLADLLLPARDIGFHLIIARSVGGSSRTYDQFLQRIKEMGSPGLIMSGDRQEGKLLHEQAATTLPSGRGYLVRRDQPPTLIQVVLSEPQDIQEDV